MASASWRGVMAIASQLICSKLSAKISAAAVNGWRYQLSAMASRISVKWRLFENCGGILTFSGW